MARAGTNHKGGRPKGIKAPLTLKIEKAKEELIRMYIEKIRPINEALIAKAELGDIQAIRELHDRVYGRAFTPIGGENGAPIKIAITGMTIQKE